jgi:hypothetical protein
MGEVVFGVSIVLTMSACSLTNVKFGAIIQEAQEFIMLIWSHNKTTDPMEVIHINDVDDEWAHLVDNSDESDAECTSPFFFYGLTNMIF